MLFLAVGCVPVSEPEPDEDGPCGTVVSVDLVSGEGADSTQDLAVAEDGSRYVGGFFQGPLVLDPDGAAETAFAAAGLADGLLLKYDATGSLAWGRHLASTYSSTTEALFATDGGVVAVGSFWDTVTLADGEPDAIGFTSAGDADGFVARFDADGALKWARSFGGAGYDLSTGVVVIADDSVLVVGFLDADATFGAGEANETVVTVPPGVRMGYIAHLGGADGALDWVQPFGGVGATIPTSAALDPTTEQLVVVGFLGGDGVAVFGAGQGAEATHDPADFSGFVARWQGDGTFVSLVPSPRAAWDAVDATPDGGAVVTGWFQETVTLGPGEPAETTLSTEAFSEMFVARFDAAGALVWAAQSMSPPSQNTAGRGVAAATDGGAVVVGDFTGGVQLGEGEPTEVQWTATAGYDPYAARYDAAGALACAVHIAPDDIGLGADAALLPDGTWLLTGDFGQSAVFGAGAPGSVEVGPVAEQDGYLARFEF